MKLEEATLLKRHQYLARTKFSIHESQVIEDRANICISHHRLTAHDHFFRKPPCGLHVLGLRLNAGVFWRSDTKRTELRKSLPGTTLVAPAQEESSWHSEGVSNSIVLYVSAEVVGRLSDEVFNKDIRHVNFLPAHIRYDKFIAHVCQIMLGKIRSSEFITPLELDALTHIVAIHLLKHYSNVLENREPEINRERLSGSAINRLADYIVAHLESAETDRLRLQHLAGVVGMSERRFSEAFRRTTGMTPHSFVLDVKVARARELLIRSGLSIVEIAALSGFASQSHMTTVFRQKLGLTPRGFRIEAS